MEDKKVNEVYVGVFEVEMSEGIKIETILAGIKDGEVRATIEHDKSAVPSLINFCNGISKLQNLKWRLLKFTNPEEVDLKDFGEINTTDYVNCGGGVMWKP